MLKNGTGNPSPKNSIFYPLTSILYYNIGLVGFQGKIKICKSLLINSEKCCKIYSVKYFWEASENEKY